MVRWIRASGVALLAVTLAVTAADAQTKPRQTTLQKRAKHPAPAGRQITVRPRPSYLTAGTNVPVGSYNGYVVDTFAQPTPIEGTFTGMRGRERLTDFGAPGTPTFSLFRF